MECTTVGWITVTLSLSGDGMHYCGMDQSLSVYQVMECTTVGWISHSQSVCQVMECTTVGWITVILSLSGDGMHYCGMDHCHSQSVR